jgi:hypothetical protein
MSWIGFFDYSTKDVIDNYNKRSNAFTELAYYFNSIRPDNTRIKIQFESKNQVDKFDIQVKENVKHYSNIKVKSPAMDSLLQLVKWNSSNLEELYRRLKDANCISIQSNYYMPGENSCEVGLQRRGNGVFYYLLFDPPIADSLKRNFNDGCHNVLINNLAAIRWYGGTLGPDCIYGNRQTGK